MNARLTRLETATSTQDVARAAAERGEAEGFVVVADEQTAGRGRAGRAWFSPPGQALYVSVVLRPSLAPSRLGWLTMSAALAICDAIGELAGTGERPTIKWFNDILLRGRKACGILVESSIVGDAVDYAVLGVGLNVNTDFAAAPADVRERATSLRDAFGREFERERALGVVLRHVGARYAHLRQNSVSPVAEYAARLDTLGKVTRVRQGDGFVEGVAARVDDDGSLLMQTREGLRRVSFGEVV